MKLNTRCYFPFCSLYQDYGKSLSCTSQFILNWRVRFKPQFFSLRSIAKDGSFFQVNTNHKHSQAGYNIHTNIAWWYPPRVMYISRWPWKNGAIHRYKANPIKDTNLPCLALRIIIIISWYHIYRLWLAFQLSQFPVCFLPWHGSVPLRWNNKKIKFSYAQDALWWQLWWLNSKNNNKNIKFRYILHCQQQFDIL